MHACAGTQVTPGTAAAAAIKNQVFEQPEAYMTKKLYELLSGTATFRHKMSAYADFLVRLGLRCPTEKSVQACVAFLIMTTEGPTRAKDMTPAQKLATVVEFKKVLKSKGGGGAIIGKYPPDAKELKATHPDLFEAAFTTQPVAVVLDHLEFKSLVADIPMRATKRAAAAGGPLAVTAGGGASSGSQQVWQQMQQMQHVQMQMLQQISEHRRLPSPQQAL